MLTKASLGWESETGGGRRGRGGGVEVDRCGYVEIGGGRVGVRLLME